MYEYSIGGKLTMLKLIHWKVDNECKNYLEISVVEVNVILDANPNNIKCYKVIGIHIS